jgi:hypothetical protein
MNRKIALLLTVLLGCAAEPGADHAPSAPTPAAQWLAEIERAHARADHAQAQAAARAALEQARAVPVPAEVSAEDRRRVLQDVQFRLAALALEMRDAALAEREAARGLSLGEADDEFTANLWIARGRAEAAQGEAQRAARSYGSALAIHEHLLDRALQGQP